MAVVQTLIGNVKGPQGETGATGAQGAKGDAATITVGSVSTTAYGNAARVENVGTENDAILNFTIPQGAPGQRTTTMSGLTLDTVTTSAEEFPVPAVGENGATVWGKVIKWFADGLAAIRSKLDANKVVNSQAVTEAGYALDAQQANPNVSGSLAAQISGLNDSLNNLDPMVIVDEAITIQNTTKTYTIPYSGLYLILARTNANTDSVKPNIRIDDASGVYAQNVGSAGGCVSVHKVTLVSARSTVTLAAHNNIVANGNYSGYGRFTIILLKKVDAL